MPYDPVSPPNQAAWPIGSITTSRREVWRCSSTGVRLFFDIEGAGLVPEGPIMREKPTLLAAAAWRPRLRPLDPARGLPGRN